MIAKRPITTRLFQTAVEEIQAAGANLLPDDFIWLNEAANRATTAGGSDVPPFLEIPVCVGNATLWPLTIGAAQWWDRVGHQWYGSQNETSVAALGYCMAHAHDETAFRFARKSAADAAIAIWFAAIGWTCTLSELSYAVEKVFGQYDTVEIDTPNQRQVDCASSASWGPSIARLCAAYHQTPHYFLWELSQDSVLELMEHAPDPFGNASTPSHDRYLSEFFEVKRHLTNERRKVEA